jgi:dTDP-glucose 4,6-dehydratase
VYGDGKNIRDWIYVEDHNTAVWRIMRNGKTGESYNIGGESERTNIDLLKELISIVSKKIGKSVSSLEALVTYVKDRPGHDRRYAIDCGKLKRELGWTQNTGFFEGLEKTVGWYLGHKDWVDRVQSGEYKKWIKSNYGNR